MLKPKNSERGFLSDLDHADFMSEIFTKLAVRFNLVQFSLTVRLSNVSLILLCSPNYYPDVTYDIFYVTKFGT